MQRVLVPLAQGCEELEAITIIDLLRRAGIDVVSAGLDAQPVVASRQTTLIPDTTLEEVLDDDFDMIVLPGGLPGADNLNQDKRLHQIISRCAADHKTIAAICAAPKVLATAGLLEGKSATAYPGVLEQLNLKNTLLTGSAVEIDGNIITSRGPGTAMDFTLTLIQRLCGDTKKQEIEKQLVRF